MAQYTTSDLSRKSGDMIADAMQAPVTITQRKKPRLVLMSFDEFERLSDRTQDTRKVYRIDEIPDDLFLQAKEALALLEAEALEE
jgi:prevent-host-death family protein